MSGGSSGIAVKSESLEALIRSRSSLKGQLTRFARYFDGAENDDLIAVESRYEKFEMLWKKFENLQLEIESNGTAKDVETEREFFEEEYYRVDFVARKIRQRLAVPEAPGMNKSLVLPKIKLPTFEGNVTNWLAFRNQFTSVIDDNRTLSDLQKLIYLKSSLVGEPKALIEGLPNSVDNYGVAWNLLRDRYENKRELVYNHLKEIVDFPLIRDNDVNSIRSLLSTFNRNLGALSSLGETVDDWDTLLVYLMTSKLNESVRKDFEQRHPGQNFHRFGDVKAYLNSFCNSMENFAAVNSSNVQQKKVTYDKILNCRLCNGDHSLPKCKKFLGMNVDGRFELVKKENRCINCLAVGHRLSECRYSISFSKCTQKHHTLLHKTSRSLVTSNSSKRRAPVDGDYGSNLTPSSLDSSVQCRTSLQSFTPRCEKLIVLLTTTLLVKDRGGNWLKCRALFDTGSESSFVTSECFRKLGLSAERTDVHVKGIGLTDHSVNKLVDLEICSNDFEFHAKLSTLVIDKITDNSPKKFFAFDKLPENIDCRLADPNFSQPGCIDILFSNEMFIHSMLGQKIQIDCGLYAIDTRFGWVIGGSRDEKFVSASLTSLFSSSEIQLDQSIERFWLTEDIGAKASSCPIDECDRYFAESFTRLIDGRFCVRLMMKNARYDFSHSREFAYKRLLSMEHKFQKDSSLKESYVSFMDEYSRLHHMEKLDRCKFYNPKAYYLPHHCVMKASSTTTKVRVVFDGSSSFRNKDTLNGILMQGPKLQNDLSGILLRFRTYGVVFIADIEKMYRQISINECDRDFLRVLWRSDCNERVEEYRLSTVTYGLSDAPYLAMKCLKQLALDDGANFPSATRVINQDSYVDDFITGADTIEDALRTQTELIEFLKLGGLHVRKWMSNRAEVVKNVEPDNRYFSDDFELQSDSDVLNVLGITWNPFKDCFLFSINVTDRKMTKRHILSEISKLFDPLGWLSPVVIVAKTIMQRLWLGKLDWDAELDHNDEIRVMWNEFLTQLPCLTNVLIPRPLVDYGEIQLVGFCDASELAYGACIYGRSDRSCSLIIAKSKIAPLKRLSIPRLELCSAVLLTKLIVYLCSQLDRPIRACILHSDSMVVLSWLAKPSYHWKTFVANRVAFIQEVTIGAQWRHVRSPLNPADAISRGMKPSEIVDNELWWQGPGSLDTVEASPDGNNHPMVELEKRKPKRLTFVSTLDYSFDRFSNFRRLLRAYGFVLRFIENSKNCASKATGRLSSDELDRALQRVVWNVQRISFSETVERLNNGKPLKSSDKLLSLAPFLDNHGLLRVGGRLENALISYDCKHPIILAKDCHLSRLIIEYEHQKNNHVGCDGLIAIIRTRFYIVGVRTLAKNVIRRCFRCIRFNANIIKQQMGSLPLSRVELYRPFLSVGIDFAGPFLLRPFRTRGNVTMKSYLCAFVCFSTRAVHFDVVCNLTSESFVQCLQRFIGRRGKPKDIYTDNGTNFVGTKRFLDELYGCIRSDDCSSKMTDFAASEGIRWHFIPPRAPNFGGLWEAAVKSAKRCIYKSVASQSMTIEEFRTVLVQIEAVLNSRPLYVNSNTSSVITPGHFLIGSNICALPNSETVEFRGKLSKRYQFIERLNNQLSRSFKTEYLTSLQQRSNQSQNRVELKPGVVVLVREDGKHPFDWPYGKIVRCIERDGVCRVVEVQMNGKIMKRAVKDLVVLPVDSYIISETPPEIAREYV